MVDPEDSRRITAILAADVAGYSHLLQGDDRATVAALEAPRSGPGCDDDPLPCFSRVGLFGMPNNLRTNAGSKMFLSNERWEKT